MFLSAVDVRILWGVTDEMRAFFVLSFRSATAASCKFLLLDNRARSFETRPLFAA